MGLVNQGPRDVVGLPRGRQGQTLAKTRCRAACCERTLPLREQQNPTVRVRSDRHAAPHLLPNLVMPSAKSREGSARDLSTLPLANSTCRTSDSPYIPGRGGDEWEVGRGSWEGDPREPLLCAGALAPSPTCLPGRPSHFPTDINTQAPTHHPPTRGLPEEVGAVSLLAAGSAILQTLGEGLGVMPVLRDDAVPEHLGGCGVRGGCGRGRPGEAGTHQEMVGQGDEQPGDL